MRNRIGLNNILNTDRKILYMILSIVMASVLTLTIVYAALSTTLNINGNAEVSAANWDIYLDNIQLNSNSATTTAPTISNKTTASFSTTLTKPSDFYEFTVDVVNNGSIDAMIDGVTKTPTLTEAQAKYLNYIVEYQNGESINNKQLVAKKSFVRLKVKLEFRKDITASDLPTTSETLNLSFTVNYVQADTTGTNVTDNGVKKAYEVISGDLQTVGSEVVIGDEHFYIISSDEDSVTMLAKMNITTASPPKQSSSSPTVDDSWGNCVKNYKTYLESQGAEIEEARLIKKEELEGLGCSYSNYNNSGSCLSAPSWVYSSSYWSETEGEIATFFAVSSDGRFGWEYHGINYMFGIRPVITLTL